MFKVNIVKHFPFIQICLYQVLCGTKPFSDKYKARKYRVQEQFLTKADFDFIMRNLPVKVGQWHQTQYYCLAGYWTLI